MIKNIKTGTTEHYSKYRAQYHCTGPMPMKPVLDLPLLISLDCGEKRDKIKGR